jgi:hypothetical protein
MAEKQATSPVTKTITHGFLKTTELTESHSKFLPCSFVLPNLSDAQNLLASQFLLFVIFGEYFG